MGEKCLNEHAIIGRLGKDPELRNTQSGKPVCSFSVATSQQWKDQAGNKQEKTEWHRIVIWGTLAEVAAKYLKKGSRVYLKGRSETREWQDKDGNNRTTTEINVFDMLLLDGKKDGSGGGQESPPPPAQNTGSSYDPNDDIPF